MALMLRFEKDFVLSRILGICDLFPVNERERPYSTSIPMISQISLSPTNIAAVLRIAVESRSWGLIWL